MERRYTHGDVAPDLGVADWAPMGSLLGEAPMTIVDPLHQLRDLDRSSPQFNGQLAKFLDRKAYIKALPNLCDEDLVWLVEYLDCVSF